MTNNIDGEKKKKEKVRRPPPTEPSPSFSDGEICEEGRKLLNTKVPDGRCMTDTFYSR